MPKAKHSSDTMERLAAYYGTMCGVAWMKSHGARNRGHMALNQTNLPDQDAAMKQHARDTITPHPYIFL